MKKRENGVLLPISSLPSKYGIGCLSKEAYAFVDQLQAAGQSLWQILPLGSTGYGDSPYQSFSTFAGNPYFVDLEQLIERGWLSEEECASFDWGRDETRVDYEKIYQNRFQALKIAFERSHIEADEDYRYFCAEQAEWLENYARYAAFKVHFDNRSWTEWPQPIKLREWEACDQLAAELSGEISFYRFIQYLFLRQWFNLKRYANDRGVSIVGDIPIYVAFDSADTWSEPELFCLDEDRLPTAVAGCPPDAFSATGQLWGNPLYRWEYHRDSGYAWWIRRMRHCYNLYDVVRIDHFRGFDAFYAIPFGAETAVNGEWRPGPGIELFNRLKAVLGERRVIAEDLGYLTDSVLQLVKDTGFPGMKVLEFAFDASGKSEYLPHLYPQNAVVYTGTHDNDTILGWLETLSEADRAFAFDYLQIDSAADFHWKMIALAMGSVADLCIIPMQDLLGLGTQARINTPSTLGGNWAWRMQPGAFSEDIIARLRRMTMIYGR
ncbi:MAG: 4-alpha-glucanotransferase [Lachnospiraceae bacterium]|nr:4-alpha-glucanotransferase [Lachnospiraceae bacterium]MDY5742311.1 4-alpha-glucanotransferase [Lachnospiraceae bacterium]